MGHFRIEVWPRVQAPSSVVSLLLANATSALRRGSGDGVVQWWWR